MTPNNLLATLVFLGAALGVTSAQAAQQERAETSPAPHPEVESVQEPEQELKPVSTRLFGLGVFTRGGMAAYRSVGCACVDRKTWRAGLGARLHVGPYLAAEVGVHYGMMMLGGNFPLNGWEVAARWQPAPHAGARAVAGLYTRLGYTSMQVMGMRAAGSPGVSAALGWSWEVIPMLSLEVEAGAQRHLGDMAHWQIGGQLGLGTRF